MEFRCPRMVGCVGAALAVVAWTGLAAAAELTREQKEEFLRTAKVVKTKPASKGVTGVLQATLQSEDGSLTHDAAIQRIDEKKAEFKSDRGSEINFRDSYKFNLAAYKLALLLDLDMIPPHVERSFGGSSGSFSWWVDDVIMDQGQMQKKVKPPNQNEYNAQFSIMQVFNQLIYNVDANQGNLVISKDWKLWMLDQSRAFRMHHTLENPKILNMCERSLLARMKTLDEATLKRELGGHLTNMEIEGLLKRRDKIVAFFDKAGQKALYSYSTKR